VSPDQLLDCLISALDHQFRERWHVGTHGRHLVMRHRSVTAGSAPPRRALSPATVLDLVGKEFAGAGVPRSPLLPLRWGRDTDLLISAVQGLDPWLKDGRRQVLREGYLPQPVVRFTGERDGSGRLRDGFLTSFVNLSCAQRIPDVERHVELMDTWISALSAVGIHAGRLSIHADLTPWRRGPVSGITIFIDCDGTSFSDAVLLWNTANPAHLATDIGSGLERLCWLLSPDPWHQTVFGDDSRLWPGDVLDSIRTATLLVMNGIRPSSRGPGLALRRVLCRVPQPMAAAGLGRLVRTQRSYWATTGVTGSTWPSIATVIEDGVLALPCQPDT
jgi:hypothetical protein